MGSERACRARCGADEGEGRALLETDELLFRGAFRVKIPLKDVTSATANGGTLRVTWTGGAAEFDLGEHTAKWADKIANPKSRIEKMGVKRGARASVVGVTDATFREEVARAGADASARLRKQSDVVIVQIDRVADLAKAPMWKAALARTGALWVVHPKGPSGVKDVEVLAAVKRAGLVDNKVVRFSATHSALRFVVPFAKR